jgi:hypothetical protein
MGDSPRQRAVCRAMPVYFAAQGCGGKRPNVSGSLSQLVLLGSARISRRFLG